MSKVAAAITSPVTKAAKQENSTKSLRSIRIRAPSPLLRGLRLASKRLIVAKDRARRHRVEAPWLDLPLRPLTALDQEQESGGSGGEAGRRGGLGKRAVTELERKHLAETDRHIAECKNYIAKQRELIERAIQRGRSTEVAETTLEALEESLRAFERQRRLFLDRLKERER
jgi:hypothetical protein